MNRNVFGRYPRTLDDLHQVWEKYNHKNPPMPFGEYIINRYANRKWPEVFEMVDNWTAYSMVADIFK